ncbi:hypothetical protein [Piscinibacter terrae]|uniref:Uncharacterized protein n=1 Tax=Piscinibacter terrae TaxID=2496871 RepID=A0A3N7HX07_9BURK|nr:hypothetical protein [Albitalea terrae]RQP26423.1 hypothetical protein DZC73_05260 [Albitalea terrae]
MAMVRRPHYYSEDSLRLLFKMEGLFYLRLSNGGLAGVLKSMCMAGRDYAKFLQHYPTVQCEPLEWFYLCRRASCSLDEPLLQDLLFSYSWREANWGAWLALLAPRSSFVDHLEERRPTLSHGAHVMELALAACGDRRVPDTLVQQARWASEIRGLLELMPRAFSPMRLNPSQEQEVAMSGSVEDVRAAFRQGGLQQAKLVLKQGPWSDYVLTPAEWLAKAAGATVGPPMPATSP